MAGWQARGPRSTSLTVGPSALLDRGSSWGVRSGNRGSSSPASTENRGSSSMAGWPARGPWPTFVTVGPPAFRPWVLLRLEVGTVGPPPLRVRGTVGPPLWLAGPLVGPGR